MRKIVISAGYHTFYDSVRKRKRKVREAKVVVVVYDENGKIATGIPRKDV